MKKLERSLFLVLFFAAGAALASTVLPMDLTALALQADAVVLGRCLGSKVVWNAAHTRIYTDWTVAVDQTLKGSPGQKIVVRQLGGELDGVGMIAAGITRLAPGQEVVLFLGSRQEQGVRRTLGLSQGLFPVTTEPQTGRKSVRTSSALVSSTASQTGSQAAELPLDQFLAQVRKILEAKP